MNNEQHAKTSTGEGWKCTWCLAPTVYFTTDETHDGAYDIYNYHCHSCGKRWRVVDEVD